MLKINNNDSDWEILFILLIFNYLCEIYFI